MDDFRPEEQNVTSLFEFRHAHIEGNTKDLRQSNQTIDLEGEDEGEFDVVESLLNEFSEYEHLFDDDEEDDEDPSELVQTITFAPELDDRPKNPQLDYFYEYQFPQNIVSIEEKKSEMKQLKNICDKIQYLLNKIHYYESKTK
jgi:hypothetical protein